MTISAARLQFLLARTDEFTSRVQISLCKVAAQVMTEQTGNANHAARVIYARAVLNNPGVVASAAAVYLAQATNVAGTITMEDEGPRTSVTDAALDSQVATDWNKLAGIDSGN